MTEASGKNQGKNVFCCSYLHIYDYANARPSVRPFGWLRLVEEMMAEPIAYIGPKGARKKEKQGKIRSE